MNLEQIEKSMRPQFIWDREGLKLLQTDENMEGSKDVGRIIFVGLTDMYGIAQKDVREYLDLSYDVYRHCLTEFRERYKSYLNRDGNNKRFGNKVGLCLNAIKFNYNTKPFLNLTDYVTD